MHDIQWIDLEGVVNMRDVGGMPTLDGGTIASGRLIRSDNLQELSDAAIRRLVDELGVTDVVDLRTHVEVAQEGAGPLVGHPSVQISHFTLYADDSAESGIPDSERELPWETQARREAAARARREQANGDVRGTSGDQSSKPHIVPGGQDHDDFWSDHYLSYLGQRPESVVGALRAIADAKGAVVVHCAAGKDRTGTITGLALVVAEGLEAAKKFIKVLCEAQADLAARSAKETIEFPRFLDYEADVYAAVEGDAHDATAAALTIAGKTEREDTLDAIKSGLHAKFVGDGETVGEFAGRQKEVSAAFRALQKKLVRQRILRDSVRIDGRGLRDIRALGAEVEVLPRVHGSAIFERGETQIMGVTTLNMLKMEQQLDTLSPVTRKRYMHNYNFPPFSTGETGRVGSPKRREVGHGALAERALMPVLPTREEFPYAIRQVSEALGSNGSTSMGSVCASTLSLLNAGVPLRAPVAGIAMGLVSDTVDGETRYAALTDILGAEDAFGDMDFKVAGTREFVTAIQLDTKLDGIPASVLASALTQAREARLHILDVMGEAIDAPDEMSPFAPRIITVKVPVDKIGEVIGPKGKMINQIQDDTGADISIEDDGTVYIGAVDGPSAEAARAAINAIANPQMPEVGERFMGTVVKTTTFGAFISLLPGKDGLLHISEVRKLVGGKRIDNVDDVLKIGQKVQVELKEIDPRGKLSLAAVMADGEGDKADAEAPAEG